MSEADGIEVFHKRMARRRDLALGIALLTFAVLLWFWIIPVWGSGHGQHVITAQIVSILVGALSALMILLTALGLSVEGDAAGDDPFVQTRLGREPGAFYLMVATWAAFVVALPYAGFYLATAVALPVSFILLGIRGIVAVPALTAGVLVAVHLVFERGFQLRLPVGSLLS